MADDRWLYALAVSAVASSVAGLLVPLYLVRIGGGAAQLGVNAALSSLVGAPAAVLAGRYADRTGNRRGVVVVSLAVAALALAVLPLLNTISLVIIVNAVLSFTLAAIGPVVTMLVVGDSPESQWSTRIARLNTLQGYGSTGGLVLGTIWTIGIGATLATGVTQASLFVVAALFGIAAAVLAYQSVPGRATLDVGPSRSSRIATILSRTSRNVRDDTFSFGTTRVFWAVRALSPTRLAALRTSIPTVLWVYFAAAFLFFAGFSVFWAPLPVYLSERASFGTGAIFALYLVNNVASTVFYDNAGTLANRYDIWFVQGSVLGVRAVVFVAIAVLGVLSLGFLSTGGVGPLLVIAGLLSLIGVTWAFIAVTGTAIVSKFASARTRGSILGLYAALSAVAGAVGSVLGGWIASRAFDWAFVVAAVLVLAGGGVVLVARQLSANRQPGSAPETTASTDS
jgi:MFS family permease